MNSGTRKGLASGERAGSGSERQEEENDDPHKHVLKFHKKLLTKNSNDDSSSYSADSLGEPLPDKFSMTEAPKGVFSKEEKPKALPPKLDLSRAKKLQELQANKAIKQAVNTNIPGVDPKIMEQVHR